MDIGDISISCYLFWIAIFLVSLKGFQCIARTRTGVDNTELVGGGTKSRKRLKRIPSAPWIPLLGSIPFLGRHACRVITKWGKEKNLGSIFRVKFGTLDAVILNDYDTIRECFVRNSNYFSGREQSHFVKELWKGHGLIFVDYGDKWKSQSKFSHSAFRKLIGKDKLCEISAKEGQTMLQAMRMQLSGKSVAEGHSYANYRKVKMDCDEKKCYCRSVSYNSNDNDERRWTCLNIDHIVHQANVNIICQVLFGRAFHRDEKEYCDVLAETPVQARKSFNAFVTVYLVPFLRNIPPIRGIIDEALDLRRATFKMIHEIVKDHIDNFHEINGDSDFVDLYIDRMAHLKGKDDDDCFFTHDQLYALLFDLFTGGAETAAETLNWALLYLAKDTELQQQLREEIKNALRTSDCEYSRNLTSILHLTRATIYETSRIRPILSLGFSRKVTEDCEVMGFKLRANTTVMPNIWAVHHNEDEYPNPEVFDPRRHINDSGEFVKSKPMVGFSIGPRQCVGRTLAEITILFNLVYLLDNFEFQLPKIWNSDSKSYETASFDYRGTEGQILLPPEYWLRWRAIS